MIGALSCLRKSLPSYVRISGAWYLRQSGERLSAVHRTRLISSGIFYLWSSLAEGSHFTFRFTPRYAILARAAPATLSDYYNPDLRAVLEPETFFVTGQLQK
jgi:hypothetical protein